MDNSNYYYSEIYADTEFEYRHVILPPEMVSMSRKDVKKLLTPEEWQMMGVRMGREWVHYMYHDKEPNILLFKRPLNWRSSSMEAGPSFYDEPASARPTEPPLLPKRNSRRSDDSDEPSP